jgi:hypothetical protein
VNPPENVVCHAGMVLIVLGAANEVRSARQDATPRAFSTKI